VAVKVQLRFDRESCVIVREVSVQRIRGCSALSRSCVRTVASICALSALDNAFGSTSAP